MNHNFLTVQEVHEHLGQPRKTIGIEEIRQCPYCMDSGMDNLKFNPKKGVLTCFKDSSHSHNIFRDIKLKNKDNVIQFQQQKTKPVEQQYKPDIEELERLQIYQIQCSDELLNDNKSLAYLQKVRGINRETVDFCGIGIDRQKRRWVFPVYDMDDMLVGFEYRPPDFKVFSNGAKCYKEQKTPTCFSQINGRIKTTESLYIVEGFIDGYTFYQAAREKEQNEYLHVITPSNGVGTILPLLEKFKDFNKYKEVFLFLDADKAGLSTMKKAKELYPFIETLILECGCSDINEHYLDCKYGKEEEA